MSCCKSPTRSVSEDDVGCVDTFEFQTWIVESSFGRDCKLIIGKCKLKNADTTGLQVRRPRWARPNGALTDELQQKSDGIPSPSGLSGRDERLSGS